MKRITVLGLVILVPIGIAMIFFGSEIRDGSNGFFNVVPDDVAAVIKENRAEEERMRQELENLDNTDVFDFIELAVEQERNQREEDPAIAETARYKVEISTNWSVENHGEDFYPNNAHFSSPVMWTIAQNRNVFTVGSQPSAGIEEMAETGKTSSLEQELLSIGPSGGLYHYLIGERQQAVETKEYEIRASRLNPIFNIVSMIAPSPDWFISTEQIELFDGKKWVGAAEFDFKAFDAGTESGTEFTLNNPETNDVIKELVDIPSSELPVFATVKITRILEDQE